MRVSRHVVVLDAGRLLLAGSPAEVAADPRVIAAYLGDDWSEVGNDMERCFARDASARRPVRVGRGPPRNRPQHRASGEIVVLLGPNGAGKTTLLRAISRVVSTRGTIELAGVDIAGWSGARTASRRPRPCPRGAGHVRRSDRGGEPASRRYSPVRAGGAIDHARRPRPRLHDIPRARRHARPCRRSALRRTTADACDRPRADGTPTAAAHRRALARPRAPADPAAVRGTGRTSGATGRRRCSSRSRTRDSPWRSPTASLSWRMAASPPAGPAAEFRDGDVIRRAYLGETATDAERTGSRK